MKRFLMSFVDWICGGEWKRWIFGWGNEEVFFQSGERENLGKENVRKIHLDRDRIYIIFESILGGWWKRGI